MSGNDTGPAPAAPQDGRGERAKLLMRIGLSAALLLLLIEYVGWREILAHLAALQLAAVALAFACLVGEALVRCLNWWQLSRVAGSPLGARDVVHSYFLGGFIGVFLPSSLSTDAARSALAAFRSGQRVEVLLATSASLNVIGLGLGSLLALAVGSFLLAGGTSLDAAAGASLLVSLACCGAIAVLFLLTHWNRARALAETTPADRGLLANARRAIQRFAAAFLVLRGGVGAIARVLGTMLLSYTLRLLAWFVLLAASGAEVPFFALLLLAPFITVGAALPISVAGFGGLQAVHIFALTQWGASVEQAMVFSLVLSSLYFLLHASGSVTYLLAPSAEARAASSGFTVERSR